MADRVDNKWVAVDKRLKRLRTLLGSTWAAETNAVLFKFVFSDDESKGRWELTRK